MQPERAGSGPQCASRCRLRAWRPSASEKDAQRVRRYDVSQDHPLASPLSILAPRRKGTDDLSVGARSRPHQRSHTSTRGGSRPDDGGNGCHAKPCAGSNATAWAKKMRKLLVEPNAVSRLLRSAAAMKSRHGLAHQHASDFKRPRNYTSAAGANTCVTPSPAT